MTPPAGDHTLHPVRRRQWRLGTPLALAACGALFVVSAINSEGTDLRGGRTTDLAGLVRVESQQLGDLEDRAGRLSAQIDALSREIDDAQVSRARQRAEEARAAAGLEPVSGEGVTVTLEDAPAELREDAENINDLVVHEQDITAVVNAMWDGGAEAVTVQGRRVISTTSFKCSGNSVEVNGRYYAQPFVISAVGDAKRIRDRIDADRYLTFYRIQSRDDSVRIGWEMELEEHVTAPAYDGLLDLRYAEAIRG
jgi:uncharacterized protein YlxW (UPF0749 family)